MQEKASSQYRQAGICLAIGVAVLACDWGAMALARAPGQVASIWPGDAVVLAMMLAGERRMAWARFAAGALGGLLAELLWGDPALVAAGLAGSNFIGIAICYVALRRSGALDLRQPSHVLRLLGWAGVAAMVSATCGVSALTWRQHTLFWPNWNRWALAVWLGYAVVAPPFLVLASRRRGEATGRMTRMDAILTLTAYAVLVVAVFAQVKYPMLFLIPLALFAVAYLLELEGVMAAVIILVVAGTTLTMMGRGPGAVMHVQGMERLVALQLFLAVITFSFLPISAIMTERRRLEQALREAREAAEAASALKSEFLATISHELRTPLASILGFASMLARTETLRGQEREHAQSISAAGNALLTTANDILAFSELEVGRLTVHTDSAGIAQVVAEALKVVQPVAAAKGLAVSVVIAVETPQAVLIDRGRVRQVLLNLLANAVKFTERGSVVVRVDYDAAAERLGVAVSDTGPGVEPDQIQYLFDRFSRADAASRRRHDGAGLGLAICKGVVQAMGGDIAVDSIRGQGATFRFVLPAPPAAPKPSSAVDVAATLRPRSRSLLLVGALAAQADWARDVLEPLRPTVGSAADTARALELAGQEAFDLALVDVGDAAAEGFVRAIRSIAGPSRSCMLVAVVDGLDDVESLRRAGFDGWIAKPISSQALIGLIMSPHRHARTQVREALSRPDGII